MAQQEAKLSRSTLNIPSANEIEELKKVIPSNRDTDYYRSIGKIKQDGERKKLDPVVKKPAVKQKKSLGKKFREVFLGDETQSVGDYVIHDILVPALKSMFNDMVSGGVEMMLFGERSNRRSNIARDRGRSYVSYSNYYRSDDRRDRRDISPTTRSRHDFDEIVFDSRGEAEEVLSHMVDLTIEYGMVSVADFYELSGIEAQFTDNKYGWTNLRDACTDRTRNGYVLRLPQARPL